MSEETKEKIRQAHLRRQQEPQNLPIKLFIYPDFGTGADEGDGGVRRVVEAQRKYLPEFGIEIVDSPEQADVVNVHIAMEDNLAKFLRRRADVPLVASSHGLYWAEYEWPAWCHKANEKCVELIRQADVVTAPSEWVAQTIRRNSLRRPIVAHHGVDLEEWAVSEHHEDYVLWNKTRLDPVCDVDPLNQLAELVPSQTFVSTFGSKKSNVLVTGRLPYLEAQQLVKEAKIYLCTSRETFGIGTIEAMACGVPVLGWAWGGQREIVEHKVSGWLARPGDYDDLKEGLQYCSDNREEMGEAARRAVEQRFNWRVSMKAYLEAYRQALELKKRSPKVSVVVRAYELEEYLPSALDSVAAQTSQDWECIVVDDASPDKCGEIAEAYSHKDPRFKVVHNPENLHLSGAMNAGVVAATGQYVMALDADDMLKPNALSDLSEALDTDRSLHIAYGNIEFMDLPDGRLWHSGWPPEFDAEFQVIRRSGERPSNLVPYCAMYRRPVWEMTGGFRERYLVGEDADFWTRASSYGFRAARVTEADVLTYRNREGSMSHKSPLVDWTNWYPWSRKGGAAPGAIAYRQQVPIPSLEPSLISVVIPVGPGHETYLIDALDSVDAQTFRLWEVIVVNDTGHPLDRLPSWAKVIPSSIWSTTGDGTYITMGPGAARNMGISASSARLFVPLDADDTLEPIALAKLYSTYEKFGGYVYSDWKEMRQDKSLSVWELVFVTCESCGWIGFKGEQTSLGVCRKCGEPTRVLSEGYDARMLTAKGAIHAVTALYPKEAWEKVGGFDPKVEWEDWEFQLRLAEAGVCGTRIPIPLFTYRKFTGHRREENAASRESGKAAILERWGDYFEGKKELMGCGCGGAGNSGDTMAEEFSRSEAAGVLDVENFAVVEYVGTKSGSVTYRPESGRTYQFSSDPLERQKYVHLDDVEFFTGMVDFRHKEISEPVGV